MEKGKRKIRNDDAVSTCGTVESGFGSDKTMLEESHTKSCIGVVQNTMGTNDDDPLNDYVASISTRNVSSRVLNAPCVQMCIAGILQSMVVMFGSG